MAARDRDRVNRLAADPDHVEIGDPHRRQMITDKNVRLALEQPSVIGDLNLGLAQRPVREEHDRRRVGHSLSGAFRLLWFRLGMPGLSCSQPILWSSQISTVGG